MPTTLQQQGAALPICLLVGAILVMLASNALRGTLTEARTVAAIVHHSEAFALTNQATRIALQYAAEHPLLLADLTPESAPLTVIDTNENGANRFVELSFISEDEQCPEYLHGTRRHYELYAAVTLASTLQQQQLQGFYICIEECTATDCIAAISPTTSSYWTYGDNS
jgi:hypothetical protein